PLPLTQLDQIGAEHPAVVQRCSSGLTAEVLHLDLDGEAWCLKRARPVSRVANADGATAFLTELQRRQEIESLRELHPDLLPQVVST
ncbi:hypothetical protein ACKC5Q_23230, partial [Aeromonas dhakensis]